MAEQTERVQHDGLRFHCLLDRAGPDAPWIAFSNSIVTDVGIWDAQAAALSGSFNILRYDQRGHGQTSVPPGPANFDQLGGDLIAILEHFEIGKATLVGLSMGVPTVLHVVRHRPHLVERLVLSDGQSATAPTGAQVWQQRSRPPSVGACKAMPRKPPNGGSRPSCAPPAGTCACRPSQRPCRLRGSWPAPRLSNRYDYRDVLAKIAVPTLILAGAADGNMPNSMRVMCDAIAGARMAVIPGAGHVPCAEQPQAFNAELLAFLRESLTVAGRKSSNVHNIDFYGHRPYSIAETRGLEGASEPGGTGRMKLHWSPRSPFVRKVMIVLHETGLLDRVELRALGGGLRRAAERGGSRRTILLARSRPWCSTTAARCSTAG